ncbi:MAG: hypothetical protein ACP5IX_02330 [Patescibacteria group bacterium]
MKAVGFDLDGVICKIPIPRVIFGIPVPRRLFRTLTIVSYFFSYFLMVIPQIRFAYDKFFRRTDENIINLIKDLKAKGVKIYIITGNRVFYQRGLEIWLKRKKIPYDRIVCFCSSSGLTVAQWKAKMAQELKVDLFVEDLASAVVHLRRAGLRVVLYDNNNEIRIKVNQLVD